MIDVVGRQSLDPEQMAVRERGLGGAFSHELETIRSGLASCNGDADVNEAEHLRGRREAACRHKSPWGGPYFSTDVSLLSLLLTVSTKPVDNPVENLK